MADTPRPTIPASPIQVSIPTAIEAAIEDPSVPKLYANGFGVGLSNADVILVFQRFGARPVAVVNLSYTLAKTLAQRLGRLVTEFESKIEQEILTTDRIDEASKTPSTPVEGGSDGIH